MSICLHPFVWLTTVLSFLVRFKPVHKVDSMSGDNYSGGGVQHTASAAEQTVIAQSQHHQQFLGNASTLNLNLVLFIDTQRFVPFSFTIVLARNVFV